jgi:hypothetical protein
MVPGMELWLSILGGYGQRLVESTAMLRHRKQFPLSGHEYHEEVYDIAAYHKAIEQSIRSQVVHFG